MTPNPDSTQFIRHEVPDFASDNSKLLSSYYSRLADDIGQGRWPGFSVSDISLTYNTFDGRTEAEAMLRDKNNHAHHFIMRLAPDNGFGHAGEDDFWLIYLFEGKFDENALAVRSFAAYISIYLEYNGLEPEPAKCHNGLCIPYSIERAYEAMCMLIGIVQSRLKPLAWFYAPEVDANTFEEACYYLDGVKSRLQLESLRGRWLNVKPECFKIEKYDGDGEASLSLTYIVDSVWEMSLRIEIADCGCYVDMFSTFLCHPHCELPSGIKKQLDTLFADFLTTLKLPENDIYVGFGCMERHAAITQFFYIDDSFDIFSSMLDVIAPALDSYNFQLPSHPLNLTGGIEAVKEQMEASLNTTINVVTEEEEINLKLKSGHFSA